LQVTLIASTPSNHRNRAIARHDVSHDSVT